MTGKVGCVRPGCKIRRRVKSIDDGTIRSYTMPKHLSVFQAVDIPNGEFLGVRNDHDPLLGSRVPGDFRIPELGTANGEDRVFGILCERVSPIS